MFAPTDDAFAKLPAGTVESLLANPKALKEYFEYFNEQIDYFKIRLALSVVEKEEL